MSSGLAIVNISLQRPPARKAERAGLAAAASPLSGAGLAAVAASARAAPDDSGCGQWFKRRAAHLAASVPVPTHA